MPYTANKRFSVQAAATDSGVWGAGGTTGDDINTGICGPLDSMLAGVSTITATSATYSLTFTAGGGGDVQNAFWRFTATLLGNLTVSPTAGNATTYLNGYYLWANTTSGNFTVTLTTADGSVVLPQGRRGVLFVSTASNIAPVIVAIVGSGTADSIPTNSQMLFFNASAPSGWTAVALNDYAVKIVSNGLGGVGSGTLGYSTVFGQTVTGSHTLTTSEIPSHSHSDGAAVTKTFAGSADFASTYWASTAGNTGLTGGGDGHTHTFDTRVLTAAFVLATRN